MGLASECWSAQRQGFGLEVEGTLFLSTQSAGLGCSDRSFHELGVPFWGRCMRLSLISFWKLPDEFCACRRDGRSHPKHPTPMYCTGLKNCQTVVPYSYHGGSMIYRKYISTCHGSTSIMNQSISVPACFSISTIYIYMCVCLFILIYIYILYIHIYTYPYIYTVRVGNYFGRYIGQRDA